ncbi:hypothetical protein [Nostoc sp.]
MLLALAGRLAHTELLVFPYFPILQSVCIVSLFADGNNNALVGD